MTIRELENVRHVIVDAQHAKDQIGLIVKNVQLATS